MALQTAGRAVAKDNSPSVPRAARALLLAIALSACSGGAPESSGAPDAGPSAPPANTAPSAPAAPSIAPALPDVSERDHDGDRIDDAFSTSQGESDPADVEVILNGPTLQRHLDAFVQLGGQVRHVFTALSYGWTGRIAHARLEALRVELGDDLRLVAAPKPTVLFLDEATRTGRVRPIWATGFAGLSSGASGNANITIAILDTGVDGTHTDLSGRMTGWKDYTSDGNPSAGDVGGHGTHVASIALGTGAAFGLGPGTLQYTNSGSLGATAAGAFLPAVIHTPNYFGGTSTLTVSSSATFSGGGSTTFYQVTSADPNGGWAAFSSSLGASPRAGSGSVASAPARYSDALLQSSPASLTSFAVTNSVANYPAVGDGFNALRGVAPSCKWFGAKVFTDAGTGNSGDIGAALDDLVTNRAAYNIKVINMSLGVATGTDTTLRAKANNAVNAGIVVVAAAGNTGPSQTITDPGLANQVLTIGASNDKNELTSYTSVGSNPSDGTMDYKPDLLAPGGSSYRSMILAADSNTKDAASSSFADVVSNDYSVKQGTSMASPFAAGAAALVIDALQQSGVTWSLSSSAQPLFVKMLLLASATETNAAREQGMANSPTLGRAAAPRDSFEGFGLLNPDAAVEAVTTSLSGTWTGSVNNASPARLEWERRAWGRKVSLINGSHVALNLTVPSTADLDLYVYAGTGDGNGDPLIVASSSNAGLDADESISFTSSVTGSAYIFVKRISGYGAFSLSATNTSPCGNGTVDAGEECDPGAAGATTCCTATCQAVTAGTACNDGNACTQTDTCVAGTCNGANPKTCSAADQCHDAGSCNPSTGACSNPTKSDGTACNDGNACTQTDTCVAGTCNGANLKTCSAADQCHDAGSCNPSTGACSSPSKADGAACNDGNACTQTDICVAGSCNGANLATCVASDQCHDAGSCDPSSGLCSNPAKADGAQCNDNDACTQTDQCQSGVCQGSNPVVCSSAGECQPAGTCSGATGRCSAPIALDGTPCSLGACSSGLCVAPAGGAGGASAGAGGANAGSSGGSSGASAGAGGANAGAGGASAGSNGARPESAGASSSDAGASSESGGASSSDAGARAESGGDEGHDAGAMGMAPDGSAGDPTTSHQPSNGSGCGCSEAGTTQNPAPLAWVLGVLLVAFARRRQLQG